MKLYCTDGTPFDGIPDDDILINDVTFPWEYNPHNVRLWVIGNEYGPIVALWATSEGNALDQMLDEGYETFLVEDPEDDPGGDKYAYLGNAGEPCNLDYAWIKEVRLDPAQDIRLIVALAEARHIYSKSLGG